MPLYILPRRQMTLSAVLLGDVLSLKVSKCGKAIELQQPREFPLFVLWVPFVGPYVLQC